VLPNPRRRHPDWRWRVQLGWVRVRIRRQSATANAPVRSAGGRGAEFRFKVVLEVDHKAAVFVIIAAVAATERVVSRRELIK
jgi:hypothetical protein